MTDKVYFAHGNGFPSLCYKQLLDILQTRFECHYIDKIGHNPDYPVTENWSFLVDELLNNIRGLKEPVIGIGHSLGGVLHFMGAIRDPSVYKAVILIDSPLLGRFKSGMIKLAKSLGFIDKLTPASRTRMRKHHWNTRAELYSYLKSRPLFQTFSEACLEDYMQYGFQHDDSGYTLFFDRHIEYLIFRTLPHHLPRHEGLLKVPAALIYGENSTVVAETDVRYMRACHGIVPHRIKGTHMLPLEDPSSVAQEIFKAVDELLYQFA